MKIISASFYRTTALKENLANVFIFALIWSIMITSNAAGRKWWDALRIVPSLDLAPSGSPSGGIIGYEQPTLVQSSVRADGTPGRQLQGGGGATMGAPPTGSALSVTEAAANSAEALLQPS